MSNEKKRYGNYILLLLADECLPPHGLDMDSKHDAEKVAWLAKEFAENGFDYNMPALVGYPKDDTIQLLSGTHRHRAAELTGIRLPVQMFLRSVVEERWGTPEWEDLIKDVSVNDCLEQELKDFDEFQLQRELKLNHIKDDLNAAVQEAYQFLNRDED